MVKYQKVLNLSLLSFLALLLTIGSFIKVQNAYFEREERVINQKVIEAAQRCVLEGECEGNVLLLSTLIEKGYADDVIHPRTKEYLLRTSYVDLDSLTFVWIEGNSVLS